MSVYKVHSKHKWCNYQCRYIICTWWYSCSNDKRINLDKAQICKYIIKNCSALRWFFKEYDSIPYLILQYSLSQVELKVLFLINKRAKINMTTITQQFDKMSKIKLKYSYFSYKHDKAANTESH
jgi:hypothetical protein